ncbi:VOC family protein [Pseudomonas sp. DC3000-4b1]|uniref:VOC family protein n=1 Tax=unclassified Pseudomonas TaxID=196821 RepID=UPI003CED5805
MYSHIIVGARDLKRLVAFYDQVLPRIGLVPMPEEQDGGPAGKGWQLPGKRWPQFFVQEPFNGQPASPGNGHQVSFACGTREQVDAAWAVALANGASDEGAPGLRARYAPDYYGAYCRDPEGNKLCFVHADGL